MAIVLGMRLKFSGASVNLSKIGFLVADPSELYRELFRRLLHGFGAKKVYEAADIATARRLMKDREVDFLLCAADLPMLGEAAAGAGGIDLVRAIRLDATHKQRAIPIILTMGTARRISVGQARDCGANFVLSKPVSASVFYDRIVWIARSPRPFWENDNYFGPDRRFREPGQKGAPKRRSADKGEADQGEEETVNVG